MFKQFLMVFLVLLVVSLPKIVFADQQFQTNIDAIYDVNSSGQTSVSQVITFKNTTNEFYASKYSVSLAGTQVENVEAFDKSGKLPSTVTKEGNRTKIEVGFKDQVVGIDKEYTWTLRYSSPDYAQVSGKIWQVTIPRAPKLEDGDSYNLVLAVPIGFGDPTTIEPKPIKTIESGGKLRMSFDSQQLSKSGILANFGSQQVFDFAINYDLTNDNLLPAIGKIAIPANTNYQSVVIDNIDPKPENVTIDMDGNYIAWFKVPRESELKINVSGKIALNLFPDSKVGPGLTDREKSAFTKADKYWDVDNPIIKQKLAEIFVDGMPEDNRSKAKLINDYVVNTLSYDESRVDKEDFERLGALVALNNPDKSLCSEYADLFVTLSRAAGIPARRLEGYAYTANTDVRPLSLGQTLLHAWAQYYDDEKGWVMVDPTWESANDGVDYFNQFDLNHIVMSSLGHDSNEPAASGNVEVKFGQDFNPHKASSLTLIAPSEVLAGLPIKVRTTVYNNGNVVLDPAVLKLMLQGAGIEKEEKFDVVQIPPFGSVDFESDFRSVNFWSGGRGVINAEYLGQSVEKEIVVKPFFEYKTIFGFIVVVVLLMIGVYGGSLYLHVKSAKLSGKVKK